MATPTRFGAVKNTSGGTFTAQTVGGVVMGNASSAGNPITGSMSILDGLTLNAGLAADSLPRLKSSGVYTTKKPFSSGTFAYNAARNNTWVISRITTSLSGVADTKMLFMASNSKKSIADFQHDLGIKSLTAWVNQRFSWTGKLNDGTPIRSRTLWMSSSGHAVQTPSDLSTSYMWDLADGNATNKAVDDAANPTRAIPGELVMKSDFVGVGLSSGNHFDYKAITGV